MTIPCGHIRQTGLPCAAPECLEGPEGGIPFGYLQLRGDGQRWTRELVPSPYGPSFWQWAPHDVKRERVF